MSIRTGDDACCEDASLTMVVAEMQAQRVEHRPTVAPVAARTRGVLELALFDIKRSACGLAGFPARFVIAAYLGARFVDRARAPLSRRATEKGTAFAIGLRNHGRGLQPIQSPLAARDDEALAGVA